MFYLLIFIKYVIPPAIDIIIPKYNNGSTIAGSVVKYGPPTGHNGLMQNGSDCNWGMRIGIINSMIDVIVLPMKKIHGGTNCLEIDILFLIEMMEPETRLDVPV